MNKKWEELKNIFDEYLDIISKDHHKRCDGVIEIHKSYDGFHDDDGDWAVVHDGYVNRFHVRGNTPNEAIRKAIAKVRELLEELNGGIIDILAKDRDGNTCIIEIKIKPDDERIVFQCLYYPKEIKNISNESMKTEKIRMITICPDYSHKIAKVLKDVPSVEMMRYTVEKNGKLKIHKVS